MANNLTFDQISTILNSIVSQATGAAQITPTSTKDFITVAQMGLKAGYDPLNTAISQVLGRTIVSNRPYNRKFSGLEVSNQKWGAITRKINFVDADFVDDDQFSLIDGFSIDQYVVRKPKAVEMSYFGATVVSDFVTRYKDQLDNAFHGPDEFAEFISGMFQNISDRHEQKHEALARACLGNLITGVVTGGSTDQVVHLLTEYNAQTGLSLTATTVYDPANFPAFMRWAYARIATAQDMLTERSQLFHMNITGKELNRHTPYDRQRVFMFSPAIRQMQARVLTDAFHDEYLKYSYLELVNYWQSIDTPDQVQGLPAYLDPSTGGIIEASSAVTVDNIFAVITDEEACGYTILNHTMAATPLNARGLYTNYWWHFTDRWYNDFSENAVVFTLD